MIELRYEVLSRLPVVVCVAMICAQLLSGGFLQSRKETSIPEPSIRWLCWHGFFSTVGILTITASIDGGNVDRWLEDDYGTHSDFVGRIATVLILVCCNSIPLAHSLIVRRKHQ